MDMCCIILDKAHSSQLGITQPIQLSTVGGALSLQTKAHLPYVNSIAPSTAHGPPIACYEETVS